MSKDSSAKYYQKNKEKLKKKFVKDISFYKVFIYGLEQYKNLPEDEK